MRRRMINPNFFTDPDIVANFDPLGRLLYQGLWCIADDSGCLEINPLLFKMKIFPGDNFSPEMLSEYIDKLIELKKILPYEVAGKRYGWLKNFHKHQTLNKPSAPTIPLPDWIIWHGEEEFDSKRHQYYYEIIEPSNVQGKTKTEDGHVQDETRPEKKLKEVKRNEEKGSKESGQNLSRNKKIKFGEETEQYNHACYLRERILKTNKRARVPNKDPASMHDWSTELEKLNRLGPVGAKESDGKGYSWQEIKKIIDWCQENNFWKSNILSASKLREKITILENQMGCKTKSTPIKGKNSINIDFEKFREN